jgi:phage terminase large subunit GpA-like protein
VPERLAPSQWALAKRRLRKGVTARPGRFVPFPFQIEPLDLVTDKRFNDLTLMWASQALGKTEVINTIIGWAISQADGGIMMVLPTIAMAQSWSKLKLAPMIDDTIGLAKQISTVKGAKAEATVQLKVYDGGFLVTGGANSPAALAMFSCKYTFFDEVDRYPPSVGNMENREGDPLAVAERRSETFPDSFSIHTSTPTLKGFSRIEAEMEQTDYRKWFVRCPGCGHEFVIMWKDIRWPKGPKGEHLIEQAYLECPGCGAHHSDLARRQMVAGGRWLPTRPENQGKPGFWSNAFISLLRCKRRYQNKLHEWAAGFLEASAKGREVLQTYVNTVFCESYEDPSERPTHPELLYARRESYTPIGGINPDSYTLPAGVLLLVAGLDTQIDRVEATLAGFGMGEETWILDHVIFKGNLAEPGIWRELLGWLNFKWRHPNGQMLGLAAAGIDSGGNQTDRVYKFVKTAGIRQFWALRGVPGVNQPWIKRSASETRLLNVYVDCGKALIYSRLNMLEPGPGYIHFGQNLDLTYFEQLTAERLIGHRVGGQTVRRFECPPGRRNEALDALNYALAALETLRVDWVRLAANMEAEKPVHAPPGSEQAGKPAPAVGQEAPKPSPRQRPRSIWNKW